jgi:DNA-binding MarR family transcriptional regulator
VKQEFINFLNALMEANPEVTEKLMTEDIKSYINILTKEKTEKPLVTDSGKVVLKYMQDCGIQMLKAKDIAESLLISSRAVSGSLRKLVTDGFCEKVGQDPVVYTLTEKGKNFVIDNEGENN